MTQDAFVASSDAARTAKPLRHLRSYIVPGPFRLESGDELPELIIAYETYGALNQARDNAVLVCHALSGDSHVARHDPSDEPGWWDALVGDDKHVDTKRWFVICANALGGCRGSSGPNLTDPRTGAPYGAGFPDLTIGDMVAAQIALIDHLGIQRLHAVIGGSMGGMQAMMWATRHPQRVAAVGLLATAHRLNTQAIAFDVVARNAILRDPDFAGGDYYNRLAKPEIGLAIARMLGHITYLSREAMNDKFERDRLKPRPVATGFEKEFSVGSYLAYQGDRFVERFDANSYLKLSMAIDHFDLGADQAGLIASTAAATCRWLVVSFSSDWLYPPEQSRELVQALIAGGKEVSYCEIASRAGHDAFLLPNELPLYGPLVQSLLERTDASVATAPDIDALGHDPTAIFFRNRIDYERICAMVPRDASVLDLGCGTGGLLARLRDRGHRRLVGVELDQQHLATAVSRGIAVVQADLDHGLALFADRQFDIVVLSHTLQSVFHVERVLDDMLRVGTTGIVSFPNAGHRSQRQRLHELGRAPETTGLAKHRWHNTPNIRLITIHDFEDFCVAKGWRILSREFLDTTTGQTVANDPARNADIAVYALTR